MIRRYTDAWLCIVRENPRRLPAAIRHGWSYYSRWRDSLRDGKSALRDEAPWIVFEARDYLEKVLEPNATVFEYGSGGSTLFYAQRVARVVSVEHDSAWFQAVRERLTSRECHNCDYSLAESEATAAEHIDDADPDMYWSSDQAYGARSFRRYVTMIDRFPDEAFDLVSVDGRARPACLTHAARKVRRGGYLLLDNSERPHYQRAIQQLAEWERREFDGPGPYNLYFWRTTIWRRGRR